MSSEAATLAPRPAKSALRPRRRHSRATAMLQAHGEPMIWLTGGALVIGLVMIAGLLSLILVRGMGTFWPSPIVEIRTVDGETLMGEPTRRERYRRGEGAEAEEATRQLLRTGNFDLTNTHFRWVDDDQIAEQSRPEWAVIVERESWGRFFGTPSAFVLDGEVVATEPTEVWRQFLDAHDAVRDRFQQRVGLAKHDLGAVSRQKNNARLAAVQAELDHGLDSPQRADALARLAEIEAWETEETARIVAEMDALDEENARFEMRLTTADGQQETLALADVVRAYPANQLGFFGKLGVYFSRWGEFLWDEPREANSEGGVFPAIWGTVAMTLIMSVAVVPFGVLAALYLREYAKNGAIVSLLRIAINNLAGVPSIVFGVFGLGFFCYVVGANIDELFFQARLADHTPTFGTGGLLWASLTLALLTLPVVIVTTEEALAAVPGSMREGSYACGASKWQTIWRIVLPRALPGIMTGMILAMARGAGEVAPLMLVGAMKAAPELPIDGVFPFVHPERSFMHLGYHLYDLGFHNQNSEAAQPMVFTTALLLIAIVAILNVAAVWLRMRLRKRFGASVT